MIERAMLLGSLTAFASIAGRELHALQSDLSKAVEHVVTDRPENADTFLDHGLERVEAIRRQCDIVLTRAHEDVSAIKVS